MSRSRALVDRMFGLLRREKQTVAVAAFSAAVTVGAVATVVGFVVLCIALLGISEVNPLTTLLAFAFGAVLLLTWMESRRAARAAQARRVLAALEAERLEAAERHASVMAALEEQAQQVRAAQKAMSEELTRVLAAVQGIDRQHEGSPRHRPQ